MRVAFTPKALVRVQSDIASLADHRAGVIIYPAGSDIDLKRGARGEAVWTKRRWPKWRAMCASLPEWPTELDQAQVHGVRVVCMNRAEGSRSFHVAVRRGKLHVSIAA